LAKLPEYIKEVEGVRTTIPPDFILAIRKTEHPSKEVGILAIDPKALERKVLTGRVIYIKAEDLPKLIEKLKEVI